MWKGVSLLWISINCSYSPLYILVLIMNFDSQTPIDTLIGRLLAFVIMFEKKVLCVPVRSSFSSANSPAMKSSIRDSPSRSWTSPRRTKSVLLTWGTPCGVADTSKVSQPASVSSVNTRRTEACPTKSTVLAIEIPEAGDSEGQQDPVAAHDDPHLPAWSCP